MIAMMVKITASAILTTPIQPPSIILVCK